MFEEMRLKAQQLSIKKQLPCWTRASMECFQQWRERISLWSPNQLYL